MTTFLAIKGPLTGTRFNLEEKTTIGRSPENIIEIPDASVSRFHAEVVQKGRTFTIYDKVSKNGVVVNGERVREHLLLRNDEVRIGSSVFLYDSDFDIKNVAFSDKRIYVSASQDETLEVESQEMAPMKPLERQKDSLSLIEHMSELFAPRDTPLPEALDHILGRLVRLFNADCGFIMLWDRHLKELEPVVAIGESNEIAVNRSVLKKVFNEKKALFTSAPNVDYRYSTESEGAERRARSLMCVPILLEETALGLVYLDKSQADFYTLQDLHLLQSISRVVGVAVEHAKFSERLRSMESVDAECPIIGESARIREARQMVRKAAAYPTTVLLLGETGTGKEMFARELHRLSDRSDGPFISLNCSAIPETLFESELFGHERGAFTGATQLQRGKVELAHGGTLFLDEISELGASLQPKLLHVLQHKTFYRVGGRRPISVDVRLVAATNADLEKLVREEKFRQDLLYRLSVMEIQLPPLRERREDIKPLAEYFIDHYARECKKSIFGITDEAMILLEKYSWQGNVRELENCIERAVILCDGNIIRPEHLLLDKKIAIAPSGLTLETPEQAAVREESLLSLRDLERGHILRVLESCDWNQQQAAEILAIHRNTLRNKMQEYGISRPDDAQAP
jgi:transcriptional regulator with GAF, ATPase, and Fis domain